MDLTRLAGRKSSGSLPASVSVKLELQVHTPTHNLAFGVQTVVLKLSPQALYRPSHLPGSWIWPFYSSVSRLCDFVNVVKAPDQEMGQLEPAGRRS